MEVKAEPNLQAPCSLCSLRPLNYLAGQYSRMELLNADTLAPGSQLPVNVLEEKSKCVGPRSPLPVRAQEERSQIVLCRTKKQRGGPQRPKSQHWGRKRRQRYPSLILGISKGQCRQTNMGLALRAVPVSTLVFIGPMSFSCTIAALYEGPYLPSRCGDQ